MGYDGLGKDGSVKTTILGDNLCVWKECLQTSICEEIKGWETEKAGVCAEFGWTIDRLRKNPMVLEATLDRTYKNGKITVLEKLCAAIASKVIKAPA